MFGNTQTEGGDGSEREDREAVAAAAKQSAAFRRKMERGMIFVAPKTLGELRQLVKEGEGPSLEFKRSTGELRDGMQTICAFLNGSGGIVLFGVRDDGNIEGQEVSNQTLREISQFAERFEPPAHLPIPFLQKHHPEEG